MSLEMSQVDHEIIVLDMRSDDIVFDPSVIGNRYLDLAFFIHDVNRGDPVIAALGDFLAVGGSGRAVAFVRRIAFHDVAVHLLYQRSDEFRPEVVGLLGFPGGNLHGDPSLCFYTESLIQLHKTFR